MEPTTDFTHDSSLDCWVPGADGHPDFPIQNLPLGIFSPNGSLKKRAGVAIGDYIVDLPSLGAMLSGEALLAVQAGDAESLNALFALGTDAVVALRQGLSRLLSNPTMQPQMYPILHSAKACTMHVPFAIGHYTDFYTGIRHAENVGRLLRPDNPLLPNYKYIPIGYHGRASSVRTSGVGVRRPVGQIKATDVDGPVVKPTDRLDYELEMGIWVGKGNELGTTIPIGQAADCIAGLSLLNDWSARDVQAWEYLPLGPFLAKSFHSTISPWVVTVQALAPFRTAQPARVSGDPLPLPYLANEQDQARGAFAITLETWLRSAQMRQEEAPAIQLSRGSMTNMYWTAAQLIAHHTSNGCNLSPGDLLGTGTLSGDDDFSFGSLMEITRGGSIPLTLPTGEKRTFLEDGDELILRAYAERSGFASIGFGDCRARILSALPS